MRGYHKEVPDFEELYRRFQRNLEGKKGHRVTTVVEPFSFDARDRVIQMA